MFDPVARLSSFLLNVFQLLLMLLVLVVVSLMLLVVLLSLLVFAADVLAVFLLRFVRESGCRSDSCPCCRFCHHACIAEKAWCSKRGLIPFTTLFLYRKHLKDSTESFLYSNAIEVVGNRLPSPPMQPGSDPWN